MRGLRPCDSRPRVSRRRVLRTLGSAGIVGLAGCGTETATDPGTPAPDDDGSAGTDSGAEDPESGPTEDDSTADPPVANARPRLDAIDLWTAPHSATFAETAALIEAANDDVLTLSREIAVGDLLVGQIEAEGVYDYLYSDPDRQTLNRDQGLRFEIRPRTGTSLIEGDSPTIADATHDAVRFLSDPDGGNVFVLVDTGTLRETSDLNAGATYEVEFAVLGDDHAQLEADESMGVWHEFDLVDRSITAVGEYDDRGRLRVPADPNATATWETTVAPATGVEITTRDGPTAQAETTVEMDGKIIADLDLSSGTIGEAFELVARESGGASEATTAILVEP
ncbi:hypothetical protein GWK26_13125 [haloarchaeon 3A1-DGR]|nr:hypothetical protein GWK26_13125 [haloarchaeon 3A1-DGR]